MTNICGVFVARGFDGEPNETDVEAFPGAMTNYQYDSARLPFRIAQDWAQSHDPRARAYLAKTSAFFGAIGADAIVDGYSLQGQPVPDPRSLAPRTRGPRGSSGADVWGSPGIAQT